MSAAAERHSVRDHLYLALHHEGCDGWGEISPQPRSLNGDPGVDEVLTSLVHEVIPRLDRLLDTLGEVPQPGRVGAIMSGRGPDRFASALLEGALTDWWLRRENQALEDRFEPRFATGVIRSAPDDWSHAEEEAARWRVKVGSAERTHEWWEELSRRRREVLLDFNASASSIDEVLRVLERAREYCLVVAVEQPFAVGNLVDIARLSEAIDVPISVDEGVRHPSDVDLSIRHGASLLCLKAPRVGGWSSVEILAQRALARGAQVYVGGFFEGRLGRALAKSVARSLTSVPSDIAEVAFLDDEAVEPVPGGVGWRPRSEVPLVFDSTLGEA